MAAPPKPKPRPSQQPQPPALSPLLVVVVALVLLMVILLVLVLLVRPRARAHPHPNPTPPARQLIDRDHYIIPSRATLARFHKSDALWRDQVPDSTPARRFYSHKRLGEKFGYSKRTVRRDIQYLSPFHDLPIEYFPKRGGWGYSRIPPRLSGIWMEEGELFIVAASWGAPGGRPGSDLNPKVGKCVEKLLNVLGHDLAFDFKTVSERIGFRSSGYHSAIDVATFETVTSAVLSQHELTFAHRKATREPDGIAAPSAATRLVQPCGMVCVDHSAWYILADDPAHPDDEPHTFAHFRMSEVADTGRKFEPGKPFDLEAILRDSLGIHRAGPRETVELLFDPEVARYVEEHFWHHTEQFGIADDGRLLLTMKVAINPELEGKIRK